MSKSEALIPYLDVPRTSLDVADAVGISHASAKARLNALRRRGLVCRVGTVICDPRLRARSGPYAVGLYQLCAAATKQVRARRLRGPRTTAPA